MVGLGRMGANMTLRLVRGGHEVVAFDRNPEAAQALAGVGATPSASLEDVVAKLEAPRHVWMMVPSGLPVTQTIDALVNLLQKGDCIIDGATLSRRRHERRNLGVGQWLLHDDRRRA
jgi:6-phosphogluconate dehydrogenase